MLRAMFPLSKDLQIGSGRQVMPNTRLARHIGKLQQHDVVRGQHTVEIGNKAVLADRAPHNADFAGQENALLPPAQAMVEFLSAKGTQFLPRTHRRLRLTRPSDRAKRMRTA
jgi:hypothetical protein